MSKEQLSGKWGMVGLSYLVLAAFAVVIQVIPRVGVIALWFVTGAIVLGETILSLKVVNREEVRVENGFEGFSNYGKSLGLFLLQVLYVLLWSLLLIIPGIIKGIGYSMSFYILAENPEIGISDALKESERITNGYKMDLFILALSFLGWALVCILTCGIGYFWLIPYMQVTYANTYKKLSTKES